MPAIDRLLTLEEAAEILGPSRASRVDSSRSGAFVSRLRRPHTAFPRSAAEYIDPETV